MTSPLASVVIPTFRRPWATVRAIRSALNQTVRDLEVIVVDDASGDGTAEAAEGVGDLRVIVLRQPARHGAAAARNQGIGAARASVVALLDSDDELLPPSIERRLAALEARSESPCVYSRIRYRLSERVEIVAPREPPRPGEEFVQSLIVGQGLATSALMARAEALRQCPFDERLAGVDDWDVALRLARLGPVAFVEEPLSIIHAEDEAEGSRITFSFDPQAENLFLDLHRALLDRHPRAEAVVLYKLAMRALRTRHAPEAGDYLRRVLELDRGHKKARLIGRMLRWGWGPALPPLLRWRWRLRLRLAALGLIDLSGADST